MDGIQPNRLFTIIVGVLVFLILGEVGFLGYKFFLEGSKTPPSSFPTLLTSPSPQAPSQVTLSSKEIIKEILNFIDSQRNPDGFYNYVSHYEDQCRGEGENRVCPFKGTRVFPTTNAWTTLAYVGAYQVLQDESYLSQAQEDMQKLLAFCQKNPEECLWDLVPLFKFFKEIPDEQLLDFLKGQGGLLLTTSEEAPVSLETEVRELAFLYDLIADSSFLNEAKRRLESSRASLENIRVFYEAKELQVPMGAGWYRCEYPLAALTFFRASGEEEYLQDAQQLIQEIDLEKNYSQFEFVSSLLPCVETLQELHKISDEEKHRDLASEILHYILLKSWDSAYTPKIYGEGMILATTRDLTSEILEKNLLTDSAYLVYLLSKDLSLKFRLLK